MEPADLAALEAIVSRIERDEPLDREQALQLIKNAYKAGHTACRKAYQERLDKALDGLRLIGQQDTHHSRQRPCLEGEMMNWDKVQLITALNRACDIARRLVDQIENL